jgi:hypothetical protein
MIIIIITDCERIKKTNKTRDTQNFHDRCTDYQNLVVTKLKSSSKQNDNKKKKKRPKKKDPFTNLPSGSSLFRLFISAKKENKTPLFCHYQSTHSCIYQILKFGVAHVNALGARSPHPGASPAAGADLSSAARQIAGR